MTSYSPHNDPDEILEGEIVEEGHAYYSPDDFTYTHSENIVVEDIDNEISEDSPHETDSYLKNQNEAMSKLYNMAQTATMPSAANADEAKRNIDNLQSLIGRFTRR